MRARARSCGRASCRRSPTAGGRSSPTPATDRSINLARAWRRRLGEATVGSSGPAAAFEEPGDRPRACCLSGVRRHRDRALVIVDQFEELFTQEPGAECRSPFAATAGPAMPLEADLHVLLSMRDDFLIHCHRFEALQPILLGALTLLDPPLGRLACGGPSWSRLCGAATGSRRSRWSRRCWPRSKVSAGHCRWWRLRRLGYGRSATGMQGLLTRTEAYEEIGGVGRRTGPARRDDAGAPDRPGPNSHRPRALPQSRHRPGNPGGKRPGRALIWVELLSVFGEGSHMVDGGSRFEGKPLRLRSMEGWIARRPTQVLDTLIDARLLTSYELPGDEERRALPTNASRSSTSRCSPTGPVSCAGRCRTPRAPSSATSSATRQMLWERERDARTIYLWTGTSYPGVTSLWRATLSRWA